MHAQQRKHLLAAHKEIYQKGSQTINEYGHIQAQCTPAAELSAQHTTRVGSRSGSAASRRPSSAKGSHHCSASGSRPASASGSHNGSVSGSPSIQEGNTDQRPTSTADSKAEGVATNNTDQQ